jgi:hypothetical protein
MKFLHKIKDFWLWFWFDQKKPLEAGKVLAKHFVRIFVKCPSCDERFRGHKIASFASRICSSKNEDEFGELNRKIEELYENLWQKRWSKVVGEDEFDRFEDALGVYAIKCPHESLYWVVLFEPYSIDEQIELSEWNKVEVSDSTNLLELIPNENWSMIR